MLFPGRSSPWTPSSAAIPHFLGSPVAPPHAVCQVPLRICSRISPSRQDSPPFPWFVSSSEAHTAPCGKVSPRLETFAQRRLLRLRGRFKAKPPGGPTGPSASSWDEHWARSQICRNHFCSGVPSLCEMRADQEVFQAPSQLDSL